MARSHLLLLLVALWAATAVAADKKALTADAISEVFQGFRDELQSVMAVQESSHGRSMLAKPDFHSFLDGFFGKNWTSIFPKEWKDLDLNWEGDLPFDLRSGAADFFPGDLSALSGDNLSLTDLHDLFETILGSFCTNWSWTPPGKVEPYCEGPSVTLAYNPKVCVIDEQRKQIICTPASITLTKTPAICEKLRTTPAEFIGKSCAISKEVGKAVEVVIGGDEFVIDLDKFAEKASNDPSVPPLAKKIIAKKLKHKFPFHPKPEPEPEPEIEPVPEPEPEIEPAQEPEDE